MPGITPDWPISPYNGILVKSRIKDPMGGGRHGELAEVEEAGVNAGVCEHAGAGHSD